MFDLTGKTALVTGAGQGVGFGIAAVLIEAGATVLVNDLVSERAAAAAESLGTEAQSLPFDVADADQVFAAIGAADPIDILVMFIWTIVFNIVQGNVVAPLVYNRTTDIHPAIVLAAIPAGSAVAGILGMFLVVPVLGVVGTTWRSALRILGASEDEIPGPPDPDATDPDEEADPAATSEGGAAEPAGAT